MINGSGILSAGLLLINHNSRQFTNIFQICFSHLSLLKLFLQAPNITGLLKTFVWILHSPIVPPRPYLTHNNVRNQQVFDHPPNRHPKQGIHNALLALHDFAKQTSAIFQILRLQSASSTYGLIVDPECSQKIVYPKKMSTRSCHIY